MKQGTQPPKGNIRLIGLDLDYTTLNAARQITPRVGAAIVRALKAGIVVLPATGRAFSGVTADFLAIPGITYALTSNGAKVYKLPEGDTVVQDCFAKDTARELLALCQKMGSMVSAFVDGKVYANTIDFDKIRPLYDRGTLQYLQDTRIQVPDLDSLVAHADTPVEKLTLLFSSMAERNAAKEVFAARGDCSITWSLGANLELNTATANKGAALLKLGALLGIEPGQIMAVGDSENDLAMLNAVGYAVAMANSEEDVLAAADFVTTSSEEDGVALAIEGILP